MGGRAELAVHSIAIDSPSVGSSRPCIDARVSFLGTETVAQVIFGPPGTEPILGVVALENTGVTVDPVTRTLRRMHARSLK